LKGANTVRNALALGAILAICAPLFWVTAQNTNSSTSTNSNSSTVTETTKKTSPIFRADKAQIKQAQALLKQRGFYAGDETGKLDVATRAGLKKYQEAESLKVTGTLNKVTLDKMGIDLTDAQKAM
jgi:peptidoglycan hydrolase-like protein with peptidoglycan-binding domain